MRERVKRERGEIEKGSDTKGERAQERGRGRES